MGRSTPCAVGVRPVRGPAAIEDGLPDAPDGLLQFADSPPDLAGSAVLADQLQRGLEIQPRSENPADHDIVDALGNPVVIVGEVSIPVPYRRSEARTRIDRPAVGSSS